MDALPMMGSKSEKASWSLGGTGRRSGPCFASIEECRSGGLQFADLFVIEFQPVLEHYCVYEVSCLGRISVP